MSNDYSKDIELISPFLLSEGYTLEEKQPHLSGERHLMQAVTTTSGRKLILLARDAEEKRVVIKASSDPAGKAEITHERVCRDALAHIPFAYRIFRAPREIAAFSAHGFLISIQEFIEQEKPFLERNIEEQFAYARQAFLTQESAHAATFEQTRRIHKSFGSFHYEEYLALFERFQKNINETSAARPELTALLTRARTFLEEGHETIEQYSGFLTHTDFVPHNFRIHEGHLYLLDASSIRFGNKYEGWARFLNFMTLHHPALEDVLIMYVKENRAAEEMLSLKLMRGYRLGEIIWYYTRSLEAVSGDLHRLNTARVTFWSAVLESILDGKTLDPVILETYRKTRDSLRSPEEKERQQGLH